jgi:hypothetical protein
MKFSDLDVVVSLVAFEDGSIAAGTVGTVVHVFTRPSEAYLVEFANERGETVAMVTALPDQVGKADLRRSAKGERQ